MSGGINAHWLMHYRVVTLVNQCRRLIRDEFGTRLSLTDPHLREELAECAARSGSGELKRLMALIDREVDDGAEPAPSPAQPARRMYRGQPLPEPDSPSADTGEPRTNTTKTVIYRGRRVRG